VKGKSRTRNCRRNVLRGNQKSKYRQLKRTAKRDPGKRQPYDRRGYDGHQEEN
jgi:hypothetical protein